MILARCPGCETTFRVTPEQLRVRSGKVRCGRCDRIFDALEALVDPPAPSAPATANSSAPLPHPPPVVPPVVPPFVSPSAPQLAPPSVPPELPVDPQPADPQGLPPATPLPVDPPPAAVEPPAEVAAPAETAVADPGDAPQPAPPTEDAVQAAQAAGLVAARETREVPGYSKWAEQTLAGQPGEFAPARPRRRWPWVLAALVLALGLAAQGAFRYRAEVAALWPDTRPLLEAACAELGCTVPLPRQAELISIEGSELQADPARGGLLVLQATLKNRAAFAQALPAIELTLTDTQDHAVVRKVLSPKDYLSPRNDPEAGFAAGGDLAVKLWIDAREAGAAGYRLYVFYP